MMMIGPDRAANLFEVSGVEDVFGVVMGIS